MHRIYANELETLRDCVETCNYCLESCLEEYDVKMMVDCIRLDRECAAICSFLAEAMTRDSAFVPELARACAVVCKACAQECEKHKHAHCQECARVCVQCASMCDRLAA
ncbi:MULTISPECIES: four-helix bundle copper-binding protein [unclassified Exiguobacterium]|uniref:four-helix bundle copper-binding protein n=1 Tax=unclassified Exiguobacterium TaxID=2644629 RepID=UPI00103975E6|nr:MULTISPECIES: four-helix bundle copper-binding protein [unclassified Exiguobacterium]TCI69192.1 four-helix bundle copper-binding protein [Exiguobacterium sp. IPCI3]TCI78651.1 four-helix bundle copper-binding protein [Exiguobacterium sp. IPCH1]TCI81155.1 four-helix bundle copper-binding protein [Exiguobacterium sp. IPBC4]